ncbi:MAG: hypothetical protein IJ766_09485 [Clostridia bacterium]|nr:hypothetical protein [Clostridia bacterium]
MKKISIFSLAFILMVSLFVLPVAGAAVNEAFLEAAANTDKPLLYVTDVTGAVGDAVAAEIAMANVEGFTSGDIVIQYNPYMLEFTGFTPSEAMQSSNIFLQASEPAEKDLYGNIFHEVYISLVHMEQFPAELDICSLGSLHFNAIGGGECPLMLTAFDIAINDVEVDAELISGVAAIEGEVASAWDYGAYAQELITLPENGDYQVEKGSSFPAWLKAVAVVAVVAVIALVIFFIAKGKNIVDDDDELDAAEDNAEANEEAGATETKPEE